MTVNHPPLYILHQVLMDVYLWDMIASILPSFLELSSSPEKLASICVGFSGRWGGPWSFWLRKVLMYTFSKLFPRIEQKYYSSPQLFMVSATCSQLQSKRIKWKVTKINNSSGFKLHAILSGMMKSSLWPPYSLHFISSRRHCIISLHHKKCECSTTRYFERKITFTLTYYSILL